MFENGQKNFKNLAANAVNWKLLLDFLVLAITIANIAFVIR